MATEGYFAWILIGLSALIFVALVLGFLYMVYGKDEAEEED
jgi:succinate dehydrogenase hydrophobic anchor subunit